MIILQLSHKFVSFSIEYWLGLSLSDFWTSLSCFFTHTCMLSSSNLIYRSSKVTPSIISCSLKFNYLGSACDPLLPMDSLQICLKSLGLPLLSLLLSLSLLLLLLFLSDLRERLTKKLLLFRSLLLSEKVFFYSVVFFKGSHLAFCFRQSLLQLLKLLTLLLELLPKRTRVLHLLVSFSYIFL